MDIKSFLDIIKNRVFYVLDLLGNCIFFVFRFMHIMPKCKDIEPTQVKRILIIRIDRIGDVVLSTPVIKALRTAYPESYIAMMVRPYAKEVVMGNPYLDEVILYDKDKRYKRILANIGFIKELIKKRFDLVVY